jgi:broad specificity phosphatase PhoE
MKVIVVRHGETYGNVNHVVESRTHGRLTYHGAEQVAAAAEELKGEKIDVVYSSNLQRCLDTAFILSEYHRDAPVIPVPELRERNQGDYEGKHWEDVPYAQFEGDYLHVPIPGGESWRDVERRIGIFLNTLYSNHPSATILLVTHGGTTKAIRSLLSGVSLRESIDLPVRQASIHHFEMDMPTRMTAVMEAL